VKRKVKASYPLRPCQHDTHTEVKIQQRTIHFGNTVDWCEIADELIDRIEAEARIDASFARLLGGVWKARMSDPLWERVQAVWDRRGWDGTPE
jgi:hypothetical protein